MDSMSGNSKETSISSPIAIEQPEKLKGKSNDEVETTKPKAPFMFAGIFGAILTSIFLSSGIFFVKLMNNDDSIGGRAKAVFFRGIFISVLCGLTILIQGDTIVVKKGERLVTFLRAAFGFTALYGHYVALNYLPVGDVTALVFSSPVWTSILGYFILREPLEWLLLLALPASIFGILLIAHPTLIIGDPQLVQAINLTDLMNLTTTSADLVDETFDQRWIGIGLSLSTSIFISLVYIVLRYSESTSVQATTFWFGIMMLISSLVVMCFAGFGAIPSSIDWLLLICNGFFSWIGQSLLQWSLVHESASVCSVIRTLDVALLFLLSALFLDDEILWTSVVGAIIIVSVVLLIVLNGWIRERLCKASSS